MEEFVKLLLEQVIPVLGTILGSLACWGALMLAKKLGLDVSEKNEASLRSAVRYGIGHAEEWAASKAKLEVIKPVDGAAKLSFVMEELKKRYPKLLPDELKRLIHEEIAFIQGVGATGALGDET